MHNGMMQLFAMNGKCAQLNSKDGKQKADFSILRHVHQAIPKFKLV